MDYIGGLFKYQSKSTPQRGYFLLLENYNISVSREVCMTNRHSDLFSKKTNEK